MLSALQVWSVAHMLVAAAVAVGASWALRRRNPSDEARPAAIALRIFWAGLGATAVVQTTMMIGAAVGVGAAFALISELLAYATSAVALGALAAYFAYLFTGSRKAVPLTTLLYVIVIAVGSWNAVRSAPTGIELTRWFYDVTHANPARGLVAAAPALAALLPAIGGAVAFIVLGLRSTGATRKRGLLVGIALVFWFGSALLVSTGAADNDIAQIIRKLTSMAGFTAIYVAYLPPAPLRERWGLTRMDEMSSPRPRSRMSEAMQRRVRELI